MMGLSSRAQWRVRAARLVSRLAQDWFLPRSRAARVVPACVVVRVLVVVVMCRWYAGSSCFEDFDSC